MSHYSVPWDNLIKHPSNERKTPVIYRGGKTTLTDWIIPFFPPHQCFVDVFGGGGGITFAKGPSINDVYNDVGNVALFFRVLQVYGDEVYKRLYFSPYSREYFYRCCENVEQTLDDARLDESNFADCPDVGLKSDIWIKWAVEWYVSLSQSFRKEEDDNSWMVSKGTNGAKLYAGHVDDFPYIIDRLRSITVEHKSFPDILDTYDNRDTLFVCDPPYLPETWEAEKGGYRNTMTIDEHELLLHMVNEVKGQVIICGYPSHLYEKWLKGWKRVEKTRQGGIKNSSQKASSRTEVLWIKRHHDGLWTGTEETETQAHVSGVYTKQSYIEKLRAIGERKNL